MMLPPFEIIWPSNKKVPILVSIPHCATTIPQNLKNQFLASAIDSNEDTDFFVDTLYSFVAELGITIIKANYNRWVIDLNRDPLNKNLYKDGRVITALTPTTDFLGNPIYKKALPDSNEINRRLQSYYYPYHNMIGQILKELKASYGKVLLWDAHSIKRSVPTINSEPFTDLILGSNDNTSASNEIIQSTLNNLKNSQFQVSHNHPFKGGYITRSFGNPTSGYHALQLEMTKDCYMDDQELEYAPEKAEIVQDILRQTLSSLIDKLQ